MVLSRRFDMMSMKFRTPAGNKVHICETKWFTFGHKGHYNWFWISVRTYLNTKILLHEMIHHDQRVRDGLKFIKMLFDMDYLVDNEIEAYLGSGERNALFMADIISSRYKVFGIGSFFGFRTRPYNFYEVIEKLRDKVGIDEDGYTSVNLKQEMVWR